MPAELSALAERLRQRFEWGLTAELEAPDLVHTADLPRQPGPRAAARPSPRRRSAPSPSRAVANLRPLEGALTRVLALSSLTAAAVTAELVDRALPGDRPRRRRDAGADARRDPGRRRRAASTSPATSSSPAARAPVARARQLAMYLTRELTDLSLPEIARAFNRRDHTTVMHAHQARRGAHAPGPRSRRDLEELRVQLRSASGPTRPDGEIRDRTD